MRVEVPATGASWGRVTAFDEARGLGELEADGGAVLPFHCTSLADGSRTIEVGTTVCFVARAALGGVIEARDLEKVPLAPS